MNHHIRPLLALVAIVCCSAAMAQSNGSNSSYSRFGLGMPGDQSQGYNRSMGGVGQALRSGTRVNKLNPASYSAIDSLAFLFDVGMGLQRTRMTQSGSHQVANNTSFDYVTAGFRLRRNLGMSVGFLPLTNIGYTFSQSRTVTEDPLSLQSISQTLSYSGSGGLHEFYVGAGWQPFNGFSFGANVAYVWGNVDHETVQSFAEGGTTNVTSYSSLVTAYTSAIRTWKGEVGLQYRRVLNPMNRFTAGLTVGIGHTIGSEASVTRYTLSGDSLRRATDDAFELPMTYSFGLAWEWRERLLVAADATFEQWGRCRTPHLAATSDGSDLVYTPSKGDYDDRWRVNVGAEFVPARYDRSYIHRINYRFGASYSTPYLRVNGLTGPREFSLSAGVGLPITNAYNSRSLVNVGVQWTRRSASAATLIDENIFRVNIGLSFNEAWFMKWKFR